MIYELLINWKVAGRYRNTIKTLSDDNLYICAFGTKQDLELDNYNTVDLKTTDEKEVYVYMKNVLGKDEVFDGRLSYAYIENMQSFFRDTSLQSFSFTSNHMNVWRLYANANYEWQINDLVGIPVSE